MITTSPEKARIWPQTFKDVGRFKSVYTMRLSMKLQQSMLSRSSAVWHARSVFNTEDCSEDELEQFGLLCTRLSLLPSRWWKSSVHFLATPFKFALEMPHSNEQLVRVLIRQGLDIHAGDVKGYTLLYHSVHWPKVCSILLECGAIASARSADGTTAMHMVLGDESVIPLLQQYGADVSAARDDGRTPLHLAVSGFTALCQPLLNHGADPNRCDRDGMTPLHVAARCELDKSVVKLLINHGASLLATDASGWTPLHYSARHSCVHKAAVLLDFGADINAKDHWGRTPLHLACARELFDSMPGLPLYLTLLSRGASPYVTDTDGATPLHVWASRFCHGSKRSDPNLAMIDYISLSAPSALGILDRDRRSVKAYIQMHAKDCNPRLVNLLLRLPSRDKVLASLSPRIYSPSQVYERWISLYRQGEVPQKLFGWGYGSDESELRDLSSSILSRAPRSRVNSLPAALSTAERDRLRKRWLKDHQWPTQNCKSSQI